MDVQVHVYRPDDWLSKYLMDLFIVGGQYFRYKSQVWRQLQCDAQNQCKWVPSQVPRQGRQEPSKSSSSPKLRWSSPKSSCFQVQCQDREVQAKSRSSAKFRQTSPMWSPKIQSRTVRKQVQENQIPPKSKSFKSEVKTDQVKVRSSFT